jgi:DNA-binding response OmpR family regulator
VAVASAQIQPKVLILSADTLVRDNVRLLLKSMGYQCLVASALNEALELFEQEKPDAIILDPRLAGFPPARLVAMFHKRAPDQQGRCLVLLGEESDSELLEVLDAYSVRRVRRDSLFQELWPSLDSLLRRAARPRQVTRGARLVFDSFLEPSLTGIRSSRTTHRQLLYESDILVADLSLEGQKDSQLVTLTGQVLDTAKRKPTLVGVPIVIQGHTGLMGIVKTNEWGEFHFECEPETDITLEIKAREDLWVSAGLPDLNSVMHCA